ncbi:SGNH/GDSL hydrolase family protein [candidate division KSB1 bacterium]|nr:SGNH/GDSL hydrolase family protein [candidate division KSB1 bacterium]
MNRLVNLSILFFTIILINCQIGDSIIKPDHPNIHYTGRIDFSQPDKPRLHGAGSYLEFKFKGTDCKILLEDQHLDNHNHGYIAIELDGKYQGRIRIDKENTVYPVARGLDDSEHTLLICKATEAQTGYIDVLGIRCNEILPMDKDIKRRIEFIGNSMTCGALMDPSEIPCNSADWYDQHNAYLTYGPIIARALDTDWFLSSVSGMGLTRNWNTEGPTMPEVYHQTSLSPESITKWNFKSYTPDLVSICLGTNDFSDGDGSYERGLVDGNKFISTYIQFVKEIRARYPDATICCLNSPMVGGDIGKILNSYVMQVVNQMNTTFKDNNVHYFQFSRLYQSGCDWHPGLKDHKMIAEELLPFYKSVMNWK